ncbi:hypothetical protein R0131_03495 [Clostridium sp. AL.422]|uniref:hypothetical protein n=1 Tax=Clostridium TaxID=1485 RepID=UPI00293DBBDB|nr:MULTISPECIES: hypothetical protein [unclassified Clostridium]MDV4149891.1 hypothetical protein [Clostridium sp. AL.422]
MKYEDWIMRYGAVARKRFKKSEKLRFLTGISQEFLDMDYKVDVKAANVGKDTNYNLYAGNIETAKYIIAANYDTPPSTFGILPYKLFNEKNRTLAILISSILPMVILIAIGVLFIYKLSAPKWSDGTFGFLDVLYTLILLLILAVMYNIRSGIGSQTNFLRNTSSIVAMLSFASKLPKNQRKNVAFVLTDFGCINNIGDKLLSERKSAESIVIHLDCIGNSEELYLFYPHKLVKEVRDKKKLEELNDLKLFDMNKLDKELNFYQEGEIYIASASKKGNDFLISKDKGVDNYFNMENLEKTVSCLEALTI